MLTTFFETAIADRWRSLTHLPAAEKKKKAILLLKVKKLDVMNMHSFMLKQIFSDDTCGCNAAVL